LVHVAQQGCVNADDPASKCVVVLLLVLLTSFHPLLISAAPSTAASWHSAAHLVQQV
jgi:hypothetical protein